MKKIVCNLCGKSLDNLRFKIKVTSPYIDVSDFTAHCCGKCFDKLNDLLFPKEAHHDNQ